MAHRGARLRRLGILATALIAAGCSLISVKIPERPLSARDLNTRFLTRELSYHFIAAVGSCADEIAIGETDPAVRENALRWKIAAADASERAATRIVPLMALIDSWALARQMHVFLTPGNPGGALFGAHQASALAVAGALESDTEDLARRLAAPGDFSRYERFVAGYAGAHPIASLAFVRPSVVEAWSESEGGELKLADSMGTIPEAMSDLSDRLKMSSEALALQTLWRTELAFEESGYSGRDLHAALAQLDERLARLTGAAESAPGLVADVRRSVLDVLRQVDASSAALIGALRSEREALAANVHTEREAVLGAADAERRAIAADAGRIADQVVRQSGEEARRLAREVLLGLIALAVIVLGLPFGAGYLLGRARTARRDPRAATSAPCGSSRS
jgi:hypothetical protein